MLSRLIAWSQREVFLSHICYWGWRWGLLWHLKIQKSLEKNIFWLLSLKPYANFLNIWRKPCCNQDDFTVGDPSTSNYNRCEIALYLPLKPHLKLWSCARKWHKEMLVSLLGDLSWFLVGVEVLITSAVLIRWPLCFRRLYNINPSPTSADALKGRWQAWHIRDLLMARALQCSR